MESPWYDQGEDIYWSSNSSDFKLLENDTFANISWNKNFSSGSVRDWKPSPGILLGIAVYLTIVGILSTIGNILFIITVCRWRLMRNNAHMLLLLNMAICDLAISVVGYPYTTVSGYAGEWIFGEFMCTLYAFLCFTFAQVSMNTLMAVSIFRYIAICKPHCKHLLTPESSWIAIGIIWAHALFWTVTPLVGWSSYTMEPTQVSCSLNWFDRSYNGISYTVGCIIFCYVTHVSALLWCYKKIFSKVTNLGISKRWRAKRQQEQAESEAVSPVATCESVVVFSFISENLSPLEMHVLRMNIIMVGVYIMCWTPYAVISFLSIFDENIPAVWYIFPTMFAKLSCAMNPILYGMTNRFLRKELISVIKTCFGLTTPMEEFQIMRQRQQEGLFNKEGVYTGRRIKSSCTCDRCQEYSQTEGPNTGNISQRKMIDLFVQQLREKDVEDERMKRELGESLISGNSEPDNRQLTRPSSLLLHDHNTENPVKRSASLNIRLAGEPENQHLLETSTDHHKVVGVHGRFTRLEEPTSDTSNADTIIEDFKGYDSSQTASPFNNTTAPHIPFAPANNEISASTKANFRKKSKGSIGGGEQQNLAMTTPKTMLVSETIEKQADDTNSYSQTVTTV